MSCSGTRPIRPHRLLPLRAKCHLVCMRGRVGTFTCPLGSLSWTELSQRDEHCDWGGSRMPNSCSRDELAIHHLAAIRGHPSHLFPGAVLILSSCGGGADPYPSTHLRLGIATHENVCSALVPPRAHRVQPPFTAWESGLSSRAAAPDM